MTYSREKTCTFLLGLLIFLFKLALGMKKESVDGDFLDRSCIQNATVSRYLAARRPRIKSALLLHVHRWSSSCSLLIISTNSHEMNGGFH
jgi:hypothetical protein